MLMNKYYCFLEVQFHIGPSLVFHLTFSSSQIDSEEKQGKWARVFGKAHLL